jgi:hypothetical protein
MQKSRKRLGYSKRGGEYPKFADSSHPVANRHGKVFLHRAVAAAKYKIKKIPKNLIVHHINGDPQCNHPSNLTLCTKSAHRRYHAQLEVIAFKYLVNLGKVIFVPGRGYKYVGKKPSQTLSKKSAGNTPSRTRVGKTSSGTSNARGNTATPTKQPKGTRQSSSRQTRSRSSNASTTRAGKKSPRSRKS